MTTTPTAEPYTVRAFLLGEEERDPADALIGPLGSAGAARTLLAGTRSLSASVDQAVEHQLAGAIDSFLGLDLLDVAAGGWRKHGELTAAARRTRETPGNEEVLALVTHMITSVHRPYVDVFMDGAKIGTLEVELGLTFRITGFVAVVRAAHLAAVRSGECALEGHLTAQRTLLAERRRTLDLPGMWHLRTPIPLLLGEPPSAPPPPRFPPRPVHAPR